MVPTGVTRVLGIVAAALLAGAGVWVFVASRSAAPQRNVAIAGAVVLVVACALTGYALVRSAPVWLQIIPTVGLPLLVVAVGSALRPAIDSAVDGPRADGTAYLLAAVFALALGISQRVSRVPHRH